MRITLPLRRFAAASAVTAAVLLVAGQSAAWPWGKPAPPPAPAPPPPPAMAISDSILQSAAAYQAYVDKAALTSTEFKSGGEVAQSLKFGDSYDPQQLLRGEIAYAAVIALQDPTFVANVRVFAADPGTRAAVTASILRDPAYVVAIKGSDSAAGLVIAALMDQGQKLIATGAAVKQSAYAIQHQAWSKEQVVNREQRLADAKSMAAPTSSADDVARLRAAATGAAPMALTASPAPPPYSPVVIRGMAVAALAALGQAGDENTESIAPVFSEVSSGTCLNMAKLNLYQCLAVSRPHYEDVFCLGQHVLADTGQCLTVSAGAAEPVVAPLAVSKTETSYIVRPTVTKKKRRVKSQG